MISEQKESSTHQRCIGSLTQMTLSIHTWTPLGYLVSCHQALTKAESLNKRILSEIVPTDSKVCRQQWPHEDHWEMPNPLIGYDDSYYHNYDPNANIDEKWFQGRDEWD